jgi:MoaA/NifB/PqqE/SkfB family radical SAM enzyme
MKFVNKIKKELSYQSGLYTTSPEFLSLIITTRCNFHCPACSIWEKQNNTELSIADWQKILDQLKKTLKPEAFVEINGGEPLLCLDLTLFLIKELIKYIKKVTLNTNGSLINEDILKQLESAGLDTIKISFYSLDKETHDKMRGYYGALELADQAIKLITQGPINLEVGLLLTSKNIKSAPALISYLQTLPNSSIILQPLDERVESAESKNLSGNNIWQNLWPDKEDILNFFDWLNSNSDKIKNSSANINAIKEYYLNPDAVLKYRCFAGQRNLVVYPNADVSFCFKRPSVGNLLKQNLLTILKNSRSQRKAIKSCNKYCRIVGCNFSRGIKECLLNLTRTSP